MALSPHPLKQSWPIPAQLMHTKPGPASQYFSTTFSAPPNLNLFKQSLEAPALLPTLITIADPLPFPDFKRSFSQALLIIQRGRVFTSIPIDDSISRRSSSIFLSPKYRIRKIPCTLSLSHYSKVSIPITFLSIDLTALISILE